MVGVRGARESLRCWRCDGSSKRPGQLGLTAAAPLQTSDLASKLPALAQWSHGKLDLPASAAREAFSPRPNRNRTTQHSIFLDPSSSPATLSARFFLVRKPSRTTRFSIRHNGRRRPGTFHRQRFFPSCPTFYRLLSRPTTLHTRLSPSSPHALCRHLLTAPSSMSTPLRAPMPVPLLPTPCSALL